MSPARQSLSSSTTQFLEWACTKLATAGKRALQSAWELPLSEGLKREIELFMTVFEEPEAKRKAMLLLREIKGELTMEEVAATLGVNEAMAYKLREQFLEGVIGSLEPRKVGRPAKQAVEEPGEIEALLLDIEGTTTPLDFVHRTLFPYARSRLASYLVEHWGDERTHADLARLEAEHREDGDAAPPWRAEPAAVAAYLAWLMDRDRKSTGLKSVQGRIWEEGYRRGELRGAIYPDVPGAFASLVLDLQPSTFVISGGGTAERCYARLAELAGSDWSPMDVLVGDERWVRVDDPESNEGMARRVLLDRVAVEAIHSARLAGDTIEEKHERVLRGLRHGVDRFAISPDRHQAWRGRQVAIPDVMPDHLEMPSTPAGGGIERQQGIGKQVVADAVGAVEIGGGRAGRRVDNAALLVERVREAGGRERVRVNERITRPGPARVVLEVGVARGIAAGCAAGAYCPTSPVTRAQSARPVGKDSPGTDRHPSSSSSGSGMVSGTSDVSSTGLTTTPRRRVVLPRSSAQS